MLCGLFLILRRYKIHMDSIMDAKGGLRNSLLCGADDDGCCGIYVDIVG